VLLQKRHPFISLIILTMMADHHLSLPLFKVSNDFVFCFASYSYLVQFFASNYSSYLPL